MIYFSTASVINPLKDQHIMLVIILSLAYSTWLQILVHFIESNIFVSGSDFWGFKAEL